MKDGFVDPLIVQHSNAIRVHVFQGAREESTWMGRPMWHAYCTTVKYDKALISLRGSRREKRRRAFMPLVFLDNSEWQKPGLTASTIRNLSRSLSLSSRAKKSSALYIEKIDISVRSYVSRDILTFAIRISVCLKPDYLFINDSLERK